MGGRGVEFLHYLMTSIVKQSFTDFEVIITDHSSNDDIEKYLKNVFNGMGIRIEYIRHNFKKGRSSANINFGIKLAKGEIIKPMFQDDVFYTRDCLEKIVKDYTSNKIPWGAVGFNHISENGDIFTGERHKPQIPVYSDEVLIGKNTFGCPSVIYFKNDDNLFDDELVWLMDCEMFYRLNKKYGAAHIINEYLVSVRIWDKSVSYQVRDNKKIVGDEKNYVLEKHSEFVAPEEKDE
jgi:glycosyltransferase involved in cell wall biosynthesis